MARVTIALLEKEIPQLNVQNGKFENEMIETLKDMTEDELYWFIEDERYEFHSWAEDYNKEDAEKKITELEDLTDLYKQIVHCRKTIIF